jgi:hypothetical protein
MWKCNQVQKRRSRSTLRGTGRLRHRALSMHKAVAALFSPFNETLVMDTDICVLDAVDLPNAFFAPLQDFDYVSAWECCATPSPR